MTTVLIGMDDTDNADSPGTGRLARKVFDACRQRGLQPLGVTRQQFLVDDRIPYTSHNSGACLAVSTPDGPRSVAFVFDFVSDRAAEGSDPGVCVAPAERVSQLVVDFGIRAGCELVEINDAFELAHKAGIGLRALGGAGIGVIGALGSVGLHAGGNHGRFIQLPGLRELPERVNAQDIEQLGILLEHQGGRNPTLGDTYRTLGWVRPRLQGGQPVLPVTWNEENHAWLPVDRERTHPSR